MNIQLRLEDVDYFDINANWIFPLNCNYLDIDRISFQSVLYKRKIIKFSF